MKVVTELPKSGRFVVVFNDCGRIACEVLHWYNGGLYEEIPNDGSWPVDISELKGEKIYITL